MKDYLKAIKEWKIYFPLIFCVSVIIYMIIMLFLGEDSISISILFSLLLVSVIGTLTLPFCFTDRIFKEESYIARIIYFELLFLCPLLIIALLFQWFPREPEYFWAFVIIYFAAFVVTLAGFEVYFLITRKKYNGLLGAYRISREEKKKEFLENTENKENTE